MNFQKLLILAPHTDDAELGCGASMSRFLDEGVDMHVAVFSTAEESLAEGQDANTLRDEFFEAMARMGLPSSAYTVFHYPVRRLSEHRQEVLDELLCLRKLHKPDLVLVPSASDLHQDHQVLHGEGLRVFKETSVWGYELPWNHVTFSANAFVTFGKKHLEKKLHVLEAYKSQLALHRLYFRREFIEGLACVRGVQVKADYAEAFDVERMKL